jgi:hypothetical protein
VCDRGAPPWTPLAWCESTSVGPSVIGLDSRAGLGKNLGPLGREVQARLSSLSPQQNHQHEDPAAAGGDHGLW